MPPKGPPNGMEPGSMLLAYLILALICGSLAAIVANAKAYNPVRWFLCGLLCGPLGLIAAAGLPDRKTRMLLHSINSGTSNIPDHFGVENPPLS